MLKKFWKAFGSLLWDDQTSVKVKMPGFGGWTLAAYWLILAFVLIVSVPHAVSVIRLYEPGGNETNAIAMALATELVPALAFVVAMHFNALLWYVRTGFVVMAVPFVVLSFLIQAEAFGGIVKNSLGGWALALALPYGVIVTSTGIAVITSHLARHKDEITSRVKSAVDAAVEMVKAEARKVIEQLNADIAWYKDQNARLEEQLKQKDALLAQPDPALIVAGNDLAALRKELADERVASSRIQAEAAWRLGELEAKLEVVSRERSELAGQLAQATARVQAEPADRSDVAAPRLTFVPAPATQLGGDWHDQVDKLLAAEPSMSLAEIARRVGVSRQTVSGYVNSQKKAEVS